MPIWEEVKPEDVVVLKDVMAARRDANSTPLQYNRIPITAEKAPDYSDIKDLIEVVLRAPPKHADSRELPTGAGQKYPRIGTSPEGYLLGSTTR